MKNKLHALFGQPIQTSLRYIILILVSSVIAFPILWMFTSSVKPLSEIYAIPYKLLASEVRWENFSEAWESGPFNRFLLNSVIFTFFTTISCLVLSSLAGYGFTKFRWPGKEFAFLYVLSTMMLPMEVIMIPLYLMVRNMGWINTYWGLIIPVFVDAFSVFFMRQYIESIPDEYIDSARIDGATELHIFLRVILPLSRPAIAALGLIKALYYWDQLLWPLIAVSQQNMQTLTIGVARMQSVVFNPTNWRIAISVVLSIPMFIALLFASKQLMETSALSGLK